jgi:protein ImuB
MAVTQARAMVPGLELREADPEGDAALLARLGLFAARRWTPIASVSGPDGLWLDIKGSSHLFGGEQRMCARIIRFCARLGFAARIAVAATPGAAHALARCSAEPVTLCPHGSEAQTIAPLPISALRIEEDVLGAARRLGIDRIGDLLSMPRGPLQRRFGKTLLRRLDQALGAAAEPFEPIVPQDPPSAHLRFAEPIATAEAIEQAVRELMAKLIRTLEKSGLAARTLTLLCERIDGAEQRVAIGTARATRDAPHLLRLLLMKIEAIEPGFGIEAMRLVAGRAEPLGPQAIPSALGGEKPAPDIVPLIDRLAGRLGARRLFRASAVESDVPERSLRRVSALAQAVSWPSEWPRPVRLLSPPERVENIVALLPDHPPRRFTWRGRVHAVTRGDGPERIYGEWWKSTGEADAVRDYFQVEDEEGARFWLYRRGDGVDPRTGDLSWYMHGLFG